MKISCEDLTKGENMFWPRGFLLQEVFPEKKDLLNLLSFLLILKYMPPWRNWYTRATQNRIPSGIVGSTPSGGTIKAKSGYVGTNSYTTGRGVE